MTKKIRYRGGYRYNGACFIRGGACLNKHHEVRADIRDWYPTHFRYFNIGLRIARSYE